MKIAVLGAGAGGTAIAFDCAFHGHEVRLFDFPQFPENIKTIAEKNPRSLQKSLIKRRNIS